MIMKYNALNHIICMEVLLYTMPFQVFISKFSCS